MRLDGHGGAKVVKGMGGDYSGRHGGDKGLDGSGGSQVLRGLLTTPTALSSQDHNQQLPIISARPHCLSLLGE